MNYQFVIQNGEKRVLFENGDNHCININEDEKEYFHVPNEYVADKFGLFIGRIKDAYMTVKNGDGDAISINNLFGESHSVIRFVDRDYGENVRANTIAECEELEFGYSIKYGLRDSLHGSNYVAKTLKGVSTLLDCIYFSTDEEAKATKKEWIGKAEDLAVKYDEIQKTGEVGS